MWNPTPDFHNIVQLQCAKRFDDLTETRERRRLEIAARFSARGMLQSSAFGKAVVDMTVEVFSDAGTRLIADFLSLGSDVANELEALDWLEKEFCKEIDQASVGLRTAVIQDSLLMSQHADLVVRAIQRTGMKLKRDASIAFGRMKLRSRSADGAGTAQPAAHTRDYFISHAGEDRADCVDPLVQELERRGRTVWDSESELTLGDSLLRKIDEGLNSSRFGVVVLSPDFFRKPWPQTELDGLVARAVVEGRKVILPVWHRLSLSQVMERSPSLGGLLGIETTRGIPAVIEAIIAASSGEVSP